MVTGKGVHGCSNISASQHTMFNRDSLLPPLNQVLLMRDPERNDKEGRPRSMGWAFIEFAAHEHALAVWHGDCFISRNLHTDVQLVSV